jgi:hypothetical protein
VIGSWSTSVGGEADLPQCGQIGQPFADRKVGGVIDRGFGAQRFSFLLVLLDSGVLVVHIQAGGHTLGDYPGMEHSGCAARSAAYQPAIEDQATWSGRPMSRLSRMTCSKNIRPATGLSSICVSGN